VSSVAEPRVLIAGASGFAGAIAARLVDRHPFFELGPVTSRSDAGRRLDELYPHHRVTATLEQLDLDRLDGVEAAIVAYPHGASAPVVAALRERGARVIDLSADFRLHDRAVYEATYVPHEAPQLLPEAVYGLTELHRDAIREAGLVANPGCFPTAALLALAPLARAGLIADVVVDAKTGVSGAGRAPSETTHFVSIAENVRPYKVGAHRHTPEIDQELAVLYATAYAAEPFVDVVSVPPGVRDVRETNYCAVHARVDPRTGKLLVFAAIDNLWKGTSSQAIQNLNLMFGRPETEGLV